MSNEFWIIGSLLGIGYTILTTAKKDYKDMDNLVIVICLLILLITSWLGFVGSIAADIIAIKKKLNN